MQVLDGPRELRASRLRLYPFARKPIDIFLLHGEIQFVAADAGDRLVQRARHFRKCLLVADVPL